MKLDIKSRKGFTLIELLVVIGILAVLAAIAIPSVAGLIDRANKSADQTTAKEMTNAMERFASEYELYRQDISSNSVNINGMDAVQNRVYGVLQTASNSDIAQIESNTGKDGIHINMDTKYPNNATTAYNVIRTYLKTSSSTFEPKQFDYHYFFSPDCGVVVAAPEEHATIQELNALAGVNETNYKLNYATRWIDLTVYYQYYEFNLLNSTEQNAVVPDGGTYITNDGTTYTTGQQMPNPQKGDMFTIGDYQYKYGVEFCGNHLEWADVCTENQSRVTDGWGFAVNNTSLQEYGHIVQKINGINVTSARSAFAACENLKSASNIVFPDTVKNLSYTFTGCSSLQRANNITLPSSIAGLTGTFYKCKSLTNDTLPQITPNITSLTETFTYCYGLTNLSNYHIPETVTSMSLTFKYCKYLAVAPKIHKNITSCYKTFSECENLSGEVIIDANPSSYDYCFNGTTKNIVIVGNASSATKKALAQTSTNSNVSY